MGDISILCGPLRCTPLSNNQRPSGQLHFEVLPGRPFPMTLFFDDPDDDIVQAEIAIEEVQSERILLTSPYRTYRTDRSNPDPERIQLTVPVLPPGDYLALGIVHDGLDIAQIVQAPFSIP